MNEQNASTPPPLASTTPDSATPSPEKHDPMKPLLRGLRKLFACNPFYLASAALLLFGCYRVSMDAPFLNLELARMWFNFSSVQVYEILLVVTAIFLARRRLWYDSTLLVWLENLLIFVPFILISQAAFIDTRMALAMSIGGGVLAVVRSGALRRILPDLPGRLLGAGAILLAVNVALPLIYRHFGETKVGVHIDSGPAYEMNECTWLLILPAVFALANFLPRPGAAGNLPSQHRWLPTGLFALWLAATGVHVYSLDYIYQFDLRPELLVPLAWVFAWTLWLRLSEPVSWMKYLRYAVTVIAIFIPLIAGQENVHHTCLILAALNIAACAGTCLVEYGRRLATHLAFASVLAFIAAVPDGWMHFAFPTLNSGTCVVAALMFYVLVFIALSRHPQLTVLGAILCGSAVESLFSSHNGAFHWAFQAAFVFALLHSLRWDDVAHAGAKLVRLLGGVFWVMQSLLWMDTDQSHFWMTAIPGTLVLAIYAAIQMRDGKWRLPVIPASALLVALSGPCVSAAENIRTLPVGLVAVIGSFLLFGAGTAAALTRSRWHKS